MTTDHPRKMVGRVASSLLSIGIDGTLLMASYYGTLFLLKAVRSGGVQ